MVPSNRCRRVFSLLELLAVVTILGIIAAIIVPRVTVSSSTAKTKVRDHHKATINAAVLWAFLRAILTELDGAALRASAARHACAAAAMAVALLAWMQAVKAAGLPARAYFDLAGGLVVGGAVYVYAALRLGSDELRDLGAAVLHLRR